MDTIVRAIAVYFCVWLVVRIAGKRTLADITAFDFVLLLIIGESTQQALIGNDFSIITAATLIVTLVGIDVVLSYVKEWFPRLELWMDGAPLVLVEDGRLIRDRMRRARVDEGDVLEAARRLQGLERLEQVKYAVLERSGGITIVPK
jgi:uncharacterized membrane protein YcaP (DUF421 family)